MLWALDASKIGVRVSVNPKPWHGNHPRARLRRGDRLVEAQQHPLRAVVRRAGGGRGFGRRAGQAQAAARAALQAVQLLLVRVVAPKVKARRVLLRSGNSADISGQVHLLQVRTSC